MAAHLRVGHAAVRNTVEGGVSVLAQPRAVPRPQCAHHLTPPPPRPGVQTLWQPHTFTIQPTI